MSEQHPVPIGLLWIRINDLVEALRRQKVMMENGQGGWVTAGAMNAPGMTHAGTQGHQSSGSGDYNAPLPNTMAQGPGGSGGYGTQSEGIDGWFAVEPAGAIALRVNFGMFALAQLFLFIA